MILLKLFLLPLRYLLCLFYLLFFGSLYLLLVFFLGYKRGSKFPAAWLWGRLNCWTLGARLKVTGLENIPDQGGAVILFSHSSFLDIPVLYASYKGVFNFAAKSFVFKYPIIGQIAKTIQTIEIPDNREAAIAQYKMAEERLKEGDRFMISPEGGRSSGEEILPFKSGPFLFAMKSKANLVPVVIYGAHKIWPPSDKLPNFKALFSPVCVDFLPMVQISSFTDENRKKKAEEIRQNMLKALRKHQNS